MKIVGIHGIGQTFVGAEEIKRDWYPAICDGIAEAGGPPVREDEFGVVGYGAIFRPTATRGESAPRIDPESLEDSERDLLGLWWKEAARLSIQARDAAGDEDRTIQGPDFEGRARTSQFVQRALRQLSKSRFFGAMGAERVLLFGLRQVRWFLHDLNYKKQILDRTAEKISNETRVVIAHSLGSIVAYEALCLPASPHVDTLITIGSPLGIRNLVFDVLTPKPIDNWGEWPKVRRWVNVADGGDIVALEKNLAPLFGPVEDVLVHNGWQAHDAKRYLNTREVGAAVSRALN